MVTSRLLNRQKSIEEKNTDYVITMPSKAISPAAGRSGSPGRKGITYDPRQIAAIVTKSAGVQESAGGLTRNEKIESLLTDIVSRLERIEEKIDENVYPPEWAIKPEFIRRVKKAQADLAAGKGKTYASMDDFIKTISK